MSLSFSDIAVIIVYFALMLWIGFYIARKKQEGEETAIDYILAGRKLTVPFFVGTLVATWYGNILGVGEFVYSSGVVAWVCFAFPYYIAAALFAVFAAKKIREKEVTTIPEQITIYYGKNAGKVASVIILVITIPAAYILMLGIMIKLFFGFQLWLSVVLGAAVSLGYLYTGGFKADVFTNAAQFVLMYVGFGALAYFAFANYGGLSIMSGALPERHLELFGDKSWQYVLAWQIIAFQTFVDPSFHQRCSAAKTAKSAQIGIAVSIGFWLIFDSLTLVTGLYAKAFIDVANPLMSYPALADVILPPIWKGLFVTALMATIMSTLDSYAFISATTIGNDILAPIKSKFKSLRKLEIKSLTKIGLIVTSILGIALALALPSAVDLIYKTASIAVPGLLAPLLFTYSDKFRIKPSSVITIMLASASLSAIWTFCQIISKTSAFFLREVFIEIEPMMPGILLSLALAAMFARKKQNVITGDN